MRKHREDGVSARVGDGVVFRSHVREIRWRLGQEIRQPRRTLVRESIQAQVQAF